MAERRIVELPLNRVEGDLEVRIAIEDGRIADAWSSGTLYRGFENILKGRAALDALVITPRVCGICTTTHLNAAAKALDAAAGLTPPDNALRLRNIARLVEGVQSDLRHTILMFMVDFVTPAYAGQPWFDAAQARFAPLAGSSAIETIRETKRVIELIAVIGGQWPHSSFMVPGGVTHMPNVTELASCRALVMRFQQWYETQVLGCRIERWQAIDSVAALDTWLAESAAHADGDLGWLLRLGRAAGLDALGKGCGRFLSYGIADLPREGAVKAGPAFTPGVAIGAVTAAFDQQVIGESIATSHYEGYQGLRHPFEGLTRPVAPRTDGSSYSYAKAPRYDGEPMETGPLAEALVAGDNLCADWVARHGANALLRQVARLARPARLLPLIDTWLTELIDSHDAPFIAVAPKRIDGVGYGLVNAARGALGHWARIEHGEIAAYQIVTPTAWNGSPRDDRGVAGPWEQALIGTPVADLDNPIEAGHVIRSFDPCLVCTVHAYDRHGTRLGSLRVGGR